MLVELHSPVDLRWVIIYLDRLITVFNILLMVTLWLQLVLIAHSPLPSSQQRNINLEYNQLRKKVCKQTKDWIVTFKCERSPWQCVPWEFISSFCCYFLLCFCCILVCH